MEKKEFIELLNTKRIYSSFSDEPVIFLEDISSDEAKAKLEADKVYSDGMFIIDNVEDVEDDIQRMYCRLKDGSTAVLEDFYSQHGAYSDTTEFIDAIRDLMMDKFPQGSISYEELYKMHKDGKITATNILADFYLSKKDFEGGVEFIKEMARIGELTCKMVLSWMYYNGRGVKVDFQESFELAKDVADNGSDCGIANYNVAVYYHNGIGTKQDITKAVEYYKKAIILGEYDACIKLGDILINGCCGYPKDLDTAEDFLGIAVKSSKDKDLRKKAKYRLKKIQRMNETNDNDAD